MMSSSAEEQSWCKISVLNCRHLVNCEIVKFKILSDDYSKIVMAQNDQSIDFHAQYGAQTD